MGGRHAGPLLISARAFLFILGRLRILAEPFHEGRAMSDDESTHRAVRWELGWEVHACARAQEREQLKRLLREGGSYCGAPEVRPDLDWQDELGTTALWWVCLNGDHELARLLVEAGANVNVTNADKWTAASVAARYGHDDCLEVLIAAGADLSVVVSDGDTALDKAIFWEHVECEQLLRSHGAATAAKPVVVVGRGGVGLAALHAGSH